MGRLRQGPRHLGAARWPARLREWVIGAADLLRWRIQAGIRRKSDHGKAVVVLVAAAALVALAGGTLQAFVDPHFGGTYAVDTDTCAQCHRGHTAAGEYLIIPRFEMDQCFTCHDTGGTGSNIKTQTEFAQTFHHSIRGHNSASDTLDLRTTKQCSSCHEAHHFTDTTSMLLVAPGNTIQKWTIDTSLTSATYDGTGTTAGLYRWCEACHLDSEAYPLGSKVAESVRTNNAYVPYDVTVNWRTTKSSTSTPEGVDESGTASGYWDYFTAETTGGRWGYNDTSAAGDSSHGMATLSTTAAGRLDADPATSSWTIRSPYTSSYPAMPCTDCHAKHGSSQPWMIKDSITVGETTVAGYDMRTAAGQRSFCNACHSSSYNDCNMAQKCTNCHRHGRLF